MDTSIPNVHSHQFIVQDLIRLNLVRLSELAEGFTAYTRFDELDPTKVLTFVTPQPKRTWMNTTYAVLFGEVMSESSVRAMVRLHDERWSAAALDKDIEWYVRLFVTEPGAHKMLITRNDEGYAAFSPGWPR